MKAAEAVHAAGYRKVDAYTPYPMEEVLDALHLHETHVPKLALAGGPPRAWSAGWGLQYWSSVDRVPDEHRRPAVLRVAGLRRPDLRDDRARRRASPTVFGMLLLNGFPQPYHPVFNVQELRDREPRPLLPVHRVGRPEVRRSRRRASCCSGLGASEVSEVQP